MSEPGRNRAVLVLVDGIADVALPALGDRTPLQAASTPNLDAIATCGANGLLDPVEPGLACGSDTAHLSLLGYPPRVYYKGRGAFESMGAGIAMTPGDIAFKCNFATVDESTGVVVSRRADRKFEEEGPVLCSALNGISIPGFPEVSVSVKYATEHRCGVVVRGPRLSCNISGTDPLKDGRALQTAEPSDGTDEARRTAEIVNAVSGAFRAALRGHPVNLARIALGKGPANVVLLRGCGIRIEAPSFDAKHGLEGAAMVAPTKIIAGLGVSLGFDILHVPAATGDYRTCLSAKADAIAAAVSVPDFCAAPPPVLIPGQDAPRPGRSDGYDFGFLHIKGVDDAGHDKAAALKVRGLEAIDEMLGQLAKRLHEAQKTGSYSFSLCVTGDHSTPVLYGDHSFEPVPFTICRLSDFVALRGGDSFLESVKMTAVMFPQEAATEDDLAILNLTDGGRAAPSDPSENRSEKSCDALGPNNGPRWDTVESFDEVSAGGGCLGRFPGSEMMPVIVKFMRQKFQSRSVLPMN